MKTVTGGNSWEEFCVVIFKCVLWEDAFPVCSFKQRSLTHLHWLTDSLSVWLPHSQELNFGCFSYSWTPGSDDQCHQNWSHSSVLSFVFVFFLLFLTQEKLYFTFDPTIPFLFLPFYILFLCVQIRVLLKHKLPACYWLKCFMLKIFGISFVYGVRWTSNTCCFFFLCLFSSKLASPLFSKKW